MAWIKMFGITLIALLLISMIATPTSIVLARHDMGKPSIMDEDRGEQEDENERPKLILNETYTLDELIDLAYTVRNVSMPLLNWSMEHNVTLAKVLLRLGDRFLERAYNLSDVNETRAKVYAMLAAIMYGHAPATAYPVLARTIRDSVGPNYTITDETVLAIYNKTLELKIILEEAKSIAISYNITVPDRVESLEIVAEGLLNISMSLLDKGYVIMAFKYVVRAYHTYVLAYGILIKAVFIMKLDLPIRPDEPLTPRIFIRKFKKKIVEKVLAKLPAPVRRHIIEKIRSGEIKSWRDLRKAIREEMEKYREWLTNKTIDMTTNLLLMLIIYIAKNPQLNETHDAVRQWLADNGFIIGFGPVGGIKVRELRQYLKEFVTNISQTYNVTGLRLVFKALVELEDMIEEQTGIEIDLGEVFEMISHRLSEHEEESEHGEHMGMHEGMHM